MIRIQFFNIIQLFTIKHGQFTQKSIIKKVGEIIIFYSILSFYISNILILSTAIKIYKNFLNKSKL